MDKSMFVNNFYGPVFEPFLSILWAFSNILPFSTEFAYLLTGGVPSEKTEGKKLRRQEGRRSRELESGRRFSNILTLQPS
jgi:hypothetical protein